MSVNGDSRLADGRTVALRLAGPGDVPAIAELYVGLSDESSRLRFHGGHPGPALAARFADLDGPAVSFVAAPRDDPGSLAAEARYVPVSTETAELAITVRDGYQGVGMGQLLLGALVERAREDGLQRLQAMVLLRNAPMLRLIQRYGWVLADATDDCSTACLELSAVGGMPGWPAEPAGRRVLVERRSWFDDERITALRSAGNDVRQCTGPVRTAGRACPLVASGRCRLAEEAELIVNLLPDTDPDCAAVLATHRRRWPQLLAELRSGGHGAAPVGEGGEDGLEGASGRGKAVFNPGRNLGVADPLDQSVLLQGAEPVGERLGADSGQRGAQFGEPPGSRQQVADHQHGPLPVQHAHRPRDWAGFLRTAIHRVIPVQSHYFIFGY
jgi:L-amino acid N-acyltransferase YncA